MLGYRLVYTTQFVACETRPSEVSNYVYHAGESVKSWITCCSEVE
jgi:hypothetical protein